VSCIEADLPVHEKFAHPGFVSTPPECPSTVDSPQEIESFIRSAPASNLLTTTDERIADKDSKARIKRACKLLI
jgi:hypothetical protein